MFTFHRARSGICSSLVYAGFCSANFILSSFIAIIMITVIRIDLIWFCCEHFSHFTTYQHVLSTVRISIRLWLHNKCLMHQFFMPPLALQSPAFLSSSQVLLICGSITSAPSVSVALKGIFFLSRILNVLLVSNVFVHIVRMFSECVWVVLFAHTNKARMYRQHFYS